MIIVKNKLVDLNDHLFAQLERLSDEDITGEDLNTEISRAKAITGIASQIVANAQLVLRAKELQVNTTGELKDMPPMLGNGE